MAKPSLHSSHSPLARLLSAVLSLSFFLPASAFSQSPATKVAGFEDFQKQLYLLSAKPVIDTLELSPAFEELAKQPPLPASPYYRLDDPALDQNPFFLKSQKWEAPTELVDALSYRKNDDDSVTIVLPERLGEWRLNEAFTPILDTDRFILFSADEGNPIFEGKSGLDDGLPSEGFFFVEISELTASAQFQTPVYVYFMPLGGSGWKGLVDSHSFGANGIFLTSREGRPELIAEKTLEGILGVSRMNALFGAQLAARSFALKAFKQKTSGEKVDFLLPAPGSTMGFGLLFTGINAENPEDSLDPSEIKLSQLQRFLKDFRASLLPSAQAGIFTPDVYEQVFDTLSRFGTVLGGLLVLSLVAKHTVPYFKKRFPEIREHRERKARERQEALARAAENDPNPQGFFGLRWENFKEKFGRKKDSSTEQELSDQEKSGFLRKSWRELAEGIDVLGHGMLTNFLAPTDIGPTYSLEYPLDRYAPELGSAQNSLVRRVLDATFFKVRDWGRGGKVNHRTVLLVGLLMGSIGTTFTLLQLTWAIPIITTAMAPILWEALQERAEERMHGGHEQTTQFIVSQVYRSVYGWIMGGAAAFFMESRSQIELFVKGEIELQMRKEGKDPHSQLYEQEFKRRVQEVVEENLALLGLPGKQEFLFDADTIHKGALRKYGYDGDPTREISNPDRLYYFGEHRPGLIKSSVPRAIALAEKELSESSRDNTSQVRAKALELLRGAKKAFERSRVGGYVSVPGNVSHFRMRQILTSITYNGPPGHKLYERLPKEWVEEAGEEAAAQAVYLYRKTFLSLQFGYKEYRDLPQEIIDEHGEAAIERARQSKEFENASAMKQARLVEQEIYAGIANKQLEKVKDRARAYSRDPVEILQRKKAKKLTEMSIAKKRKKDSSYQLNHHDYNRIYAENLARVVGIRLLPEEEIENEEEIKRLYARCHERATLSTADELEHNPVLRHLHHKMESDLEKRDYVAHLYAKNYVASYKEMSVDTLRVDHETQLSPHSPATPGMTMRLRQSQIARNSKVLTGALRILDSFFGAEVGYDTGLKALVNRRVPFVYDVLSSFYRNLIFVPSIMAFRWPYYQVLQMKYPFSTYFIVASAGFMVMAPIQWLKRLSLQNGLRPVQKVSHAVLHVTLGSWTTFVSQIPVMLLAPDTNDAENGEGKEKHFDKILRPNLVQPHSEQDTDATAALADIAATRDASLKTSEGGILVPDLSAAPHPSTELLLPDELPTNAIPVSNEAASVIADEAQSKESSIPMTPLPESAAGIMVDTSKVGDEAMINEKVGETQPLLPCQNYLFR